MTTSRGLDGSTSSPTLKGAHLERHTHTLVVRIHARGISRSESRDRASWRSGWVGCVAGCKWGVTCTTRCDRARVRQMCVRTWTWALLLDHDLALDVVLDRRSWTRSCVAMVRLISGEKRVYAWSRASTKKSGLKRLRVAVISPP